MADQRMTQAAVLTDPTTSTQQAGVDASGNLKVIAAANTGVDIGDVDVTSVVPGVGATNLGKAVDSPVGATDTGVLMLAQRRAADTVVSGLDGDYEPLKTNVVGHLKCEVFSGETLPVSGTVTTTPSGTQDVQGIVAEGAAVGGTQPFLMAGDDGTNVKHVAVDAGGAVEVHQATAADLNVTEASAAAILADTTALLAAVGTDGGAGPADTMSVAGTETGGNIQELRVDADGHLQVDILSGAGSSTPGNPVSGARATTAVAAGSAEEETADGTADLDGAYKLYGVDLGSSVPFKAEIIVRKNTVDTILATLYCMDGFISWQPPHIDFTTIASTAGNDNFAVNFTNLDPNDAAEMYATFHYADA